MTVPAQPHAVALRAADAAAAPPLLPPESRWLASLSLQLAFRGGRAVLLSNRHQGPLRVQKALYPEGPDWLELLLIHPPGGIASGDELQIAVRLEPQAQARLTTPGAAKWYRARAEQAASQTVHIEVGDAASLEWLPQESIHFDHSRSRQRTRIDCAASARACGWDITVLGRRDSQESFHDGELAQNLELWRGGQLLWAEQTRLRGADPLLRSRLGWNGAHVSGLFWAVGTAITADLVESLRQSLAAHAGRPAPTSDDLEWAMSCPQPGLLLARALGHSPERVRQCLTRVWQALRLPLMGRAAVLPRIWAT